MRPEIAMEKISSRVLSRTPVTKCRKQNWPQGEAELRCNHKAPADCRGNCSDDPLYLSWVKQRGFCVCASTSHWMQLITEEEVKFQPGSLPQGRAVLGRGSAVGYQQPPLLAAEGTSASDPKGIVWDATHHPRQE